MGRVTNDIALGAPDTGRAHPPVRGGWATVAAVAGGLFLSVVSSTMVSVALPSIGRDLHASATDLQWIVDAYVLVYASLLVAGGVLGDRRGRKGVFLAGVAIFGLGAGIAGLAPGIGTLLAGRVVQGLGPALVIPGSLTIIRATFHDARQRAAAIGVWSTGSGLAMAAGPALGGAVVAGLGWRAVFWLNVPAAALLLVLAARYIPRLPRHPVRDRFDWPAAALVTVALAALAYAIIGGQDRGWTSPAIIAAFAGGAVLLAAFTVRERRVAAPLVDVGLFARGTFTAANVAGLIVFFAFIGAIVYLSAYFQQVQGLTPVAAGLAVSPVGVAFAAAAPLSGRLTARFGAHGPLVGGLLLAGGATLGLLRLDAGTGMGAIWWNFALAGFGVGLCMAPMTTTAMSAVDAAHAGMASAVHNALRQLGQVLGVAVLGALVYAGLPGAHGGARLSPDQRPAFVAGLHHAMWLSGLALLAAALLAIVLFTRGSRR